MAARHPERGRREPVRVDPAERTVRQQARLEARVRALGPDRAASLAAALARGSYPM